MKPVIKRTISIHRLCKIDHRFLSAEDSDLTSENDRDQTDGPSALHSSIIPRESFWLSVSGKIDPSVEDALIDDPLRARRRCEKRISQKGDGEGPTASGRALSTRLWMNGVGAQDICDLVVNMRHL